MNCSPDMACELEGVNNSCGEVLRRCDPTASEMSHSHEDLRSMGALILRHVLGGSGSGPTLHHSLRARVLEGCPHKAG